MSIGNQYKEQLIDFNKVEDQSPTLIHSNIVTAIPSSRTLETQSKASNKITTQNVVDYSWQDRYCLGHLISYHSYTKLIAYVLSINSSYMIRILNEDNNSRCLIKDFSGEVIDVAFSKGKLPYVASIDVNGYVQVNKILVNEELMNPQLILRIEPIGSLESVKLTSKVFYSRVMWCGHSDVNDEVDVNGEKNNEDDEGSTNISLLLGIVHGCRFDVIQVDSIETELSTLESLNLQEQNKNTTGTTVVASTTTTIDNNTDIFHKYQPTVTRDKLMSISRAFQAQYEDGDTNNLCDLFLPYLFFTSSTTGVNENSSCESIITCFAISSDAGAFAAGLKDGSVRFFTLDGSSSTGLKEEYSWTPFINDAACSLLFLDDCRAGSKVDSYWCHVVVGSAFNRKLKLYRCDKWHCIQTISIDGGSSAPCLLSAHLDESACFLLASDLRRKALYVLEIGSLDQGQTRLFKSLQEFVLSEPLLSFDINTVSSMPTSDGYQQIVIKLFTITRGSFQKMRVTYHSRGHRMDEIHVDSKLVENEDNDDEDVDVADDEDDEDDDDDDISNGILSSPLLPLKDIHKGVNGCTTLVLPPSIAASSITRISTVPPSVTSSFQDPAIIATHRPLSSATLPDVNIDMGYTDSTNVPVTLQHLFSVAAAAAATGNTSTPIIPVTNDSGEESGDEASDNDIIIPTTDYVQPPLHKEQHQQLQHHQQQQHQQQNGFPKPPWSDNQYIPTLMKMIEQQGLAIDEMNKNIINLQQEKQINLDNLEQRITDRLTLNIRESVATNIETALNLIIGQLSHDKHLHESLGRSIAETVDRSVRSTTNEIIRSSLAPTLRNTMDKLIQESGNVLRDGAHEIVSNVESFNKSNNTNLEKKLIGALTYHNQSEVNKYLSDLSDTIIRQIKSQLSNLHSEMVTSLTQNNSALTGYLSNAFKDVKDSTVNAINAAQVHTGSNMSDHNMSHANSMVNLSGSVSTNEAKQITIRKMINKGNFVDAVTEALSLTDLCFLMSILAQIQPSNILSGNLQRMSKLSTPAILSLIQQISRDFNDKFDLKFDYLMEALLSLNSTNIAGSNKVLRGAERRMQQYIDTSPSQSVIRDRIHVLMRLLRSRIDSSVSAQTPS